MGQSYHQKNKFNLDPKYCITYYIISQSKSKSARMRLANCSLDITDGNMNAYAQVLNSEERLKRARYYNMLDAGIVG